MLYIKAQLNDQIEIKVDLYEDEVFTTCPACGKEHQVDFETLKELDDWCGTSITCGSDGCNKSLSQKNNTLPATEDPTSKKYLDDVFTFSIVKFTDKDEQSNYHVFGYSSIGDEVEFGIRATLKEANELLGFYSQKDADFQIVKSK